MDKYKKLLKNTILVFGGNIGAKLIALLMMPLYTRWLSVEGYGLTDLLTNYVALLLSVVSCCIPEALFVFPSGADKESQNKYYSSGIFFNTGTIILAAIIFALLREIADYYDWINSFTQNIWFIYFMLVTNIFQQQCQQYVRSTGHMVIYSLTGLVYTIFVAAISFILIPGYGVVGYVLSIIFANLISGIYSFICGKVYRSFSMASISVVAIKEMLKYSIPLIPNSIMWWLVSAMNRPVLESHLGLHDIGIYAVANRFPGILSMVFAVFVTSWQISVLEECKKEGFERFYNKIFKLIFGGLCVLLVAITFSSKLLIRLFADAAFYEAWQYVAVLSFGTLISCMSSFVGVIFSATRESQYFLYSSIIGAIASIVFNILLIPIWGIYGACISIILSFFFMTGFRILFAWKTVSITLVFPYLVVLFFLGAMIYFYINSHILISMIIAISVVLYLSIINLKEIKLVCMFVKTKRH